MKAFLVLLFLFSGLVFALPVLNVQGKVTGGSGSVTGTVFPTSACSGTALLTATGSAASDGVFNLVFDSTALLSANTPHYLKLVRGTATLVACQEFYPTQVQGGPISPASIKVGSIAATGNIVTTADVQANLVTGDYFLIPGSQTGSKTVNFANAVRILAPAVNIARYVLPDYTYNAFTFGGMWGYDFISGGYQDQTYFNDFVFFNANSIPTFFSNNVYFEPSQSSSPRQNVFFGDQAASKETTVNVYDQLNVVGSAPVLRVNGVDVCLENGVNCPTAGNQDARYVVKVAGAGTQTINNPVTIASQDLLLTGSNADLVVGGMATVSGTNGLTVSGSNGITASAGAVKTNALSRVSGAGTISVTSGLTIAGAVTAGANAITGGAITGTSITAGTGTISGAGGLLVSGANGVRTNTIQSTTGASGTVNVNSDLTVKGVDVCLESGNCDSGPGTDYSVKQVSAFVYTNPGSGVLYASFHEFQVLEKISSNPWTGIVADDGNIYDEPPICIAGCLSSDEALCEKSGNKIVDGGSGQQASGWYDISPACPPNYPVFKGCSYTETQCALFGIENCASRIGRKVTSLCGKQ